MRGLRHRIRDAGPWRGAAALHGTKGGSAALSCSSALAECASRPRWWRTWNQVSNMFEFTEYLNGECPFTVKTVCLVNFGGDALPRTCGDFGGPLFVHFYI